jgi:small subunit ribosomal protein S16
VSASQDSSGLHASLEAFSVKEEPTPELGAQGPELLAGYRKFQEPAILIGWRKCIVLAIRLARIGKKKQPFYRIVVLDKRKPRNGRTVEVVGTYDPLKNPALIKLEVERIKYWLGVGAQPSDTVRSFLTAQKIA